MLEMVILLLFVFFFWIIHIKKRLFVHTYLWEKKEYRFDRMRSYLRESNSVWRDSYPTFFAFFFAFLSLLLVDYITNKLLYGVLLLGFIYYVYSTLDTFTRFFSKKLVRPKIKSVRNMIIIVSVLLLYLTPLVVGLVIYSSFAAEMSGGEVVEEKTQTTIGNLFPTATNEGVTLIPIETLTIVLFFTYLFVFDLMLPMVTALSVAITGIFSSLVRKKK